MILLAQRISSTLLAAQHPLPAWMIPVLVAAVPAIWVGMLFLISSMFGWRELAQLYRCDPRPQGQRWTWQSAQLRWRANYNNCLTFAANERGFWVHPQWPLSMAHPALFIPWDEVEVQRGLNWWLFPSVKLTFSQVPGVPMRIFPRLADRLRGAAGSAWPELAD